MMIEQRAVNTESFVDAPVFKAVSRAAAALNIPVYVVGGYVRDCLLNRPKSKDIDFVTVGSGIALAQKVAELSGPKTRVNVFKHFGTAQLKLFGFELEFVGARRESYSTDSRKPAVENGTLKDDQNRRDFTINAMAISLNEADYGTLVDPFNGIEDLKFGIIRTPLNPVETFSDDPLRMLRAARFAAQLNFKIEPSALAAITEVRKRIGIISRERIADELNKIMLAERPSTGFALLYQTKLLHEFFPELIALQGVDEIDGQRHKDNFYHTLQVVDNISENTDDLWLRWAAMLHDIGKPVTKKFIPGIGWAFHGHEFLGAKMVPRIFDKLKLPLNEKMRYVQKIVRLSSRPIALIEDTVTDSAVRRLLFEAGEDIDDLMLLCKADITTKNNKKRDRYIQNFDVVQEKMREVEAKDHLRNWQPPIDGQAIMDTFGIGPSKEVGQIKNAIREAILEGEIPNEYETAFAFMLARGKELGLTANT
jgi:tRNA nucleotidyltransferase (CCA-adding enzyme)